MMDVQAWIAKVTKYINKRGMDVSSPLTTLTIPATGTKTYTATENCLAVYDCRMQANSSGGMRIMIDGVSIIDRTSSDGALRYVVPVVIPLCKGQTLSVQQVSNWASYLRVFRFIGGGYFLAAFSAIERWWLHVEYQEVNRKDIKHPATSQHKPHNHRRHWHLLGREPDHSQFCTNGTTTDNVFNDDWNGMCGQLCLLVKRYIRRANRIRPKVYESHQSVRKSLNEYSAERLYVELGNDRQNLTLKRGCVAC